MLMANTHSMKGLRKVSGNNNRSIAVTKPIIKIKVDICNIFYRSVYLFK